MPRRAASEDQILAAAQRVLARDGWQAASAERIAKEAGLNRVTLHRRGLTREVILARLAEQAAERYRQVMWPILTSAAPAAERLETALRAICQLAEENLALLQALDAAANAAVFHDEHDRAGQPGALTRDVFTEPLERLLLDGQAEGSVRHLDDTLQTATVLFNQVGWTYIHMRSGHGWAPEAVEQATVDLALHGLGRASD